MTSSLRAAAAGLAFLALPLVAGAAPIVGSLGGGLVVQPDPILSLAEGETVTLTEGRVTSRTGDFVAVPVLTAINGLSPALFLLDEGTPLSFFLGAMASSFGSFAGTVIEAENIGPTPADPADPRTVRLTLLGLFTPSATGALSAFDPTTASLRLSFEQTAGGGTVVAANLTLNTPPVGIPAPAGFVVLGLGLLGLGAVRARGCRV